MNEYLLLSRLELAGEVEFNIGIVLPLSVEEPFALREIHQIPVFILHDIRLFETDKIINFLLIAGDPACFIKA